MDKTTFDIVVICWIIMGCITFPVQLFVTPPYGRHTTRKWGITISNRVGWFLMEVPVLLIFYYFITTGQGDKNVVVWVIVSLFTLHYVHRAFIYPFRIHTKGKRMPLLIALMAIFFNTMNGYINGYYLGSLQHTYDIAWLTDVRFITGTVLNIDGGLAI